MNASVAWSSAHRAITSSTLPRWHLAWRMQMVAAENRDSVPLYWMSAATPTNMTMTPVGQLKPRSCFTSSGDHTLDTPSAPATDASQIARQCSLTPACRSSAELQGQRPGQSALLRAALIRCGERCALQTTATMIRRLGAWRVNGLVGELNVLKRSVTSNPLNLMTGVRSMPPFMESMKLCADVPAGQPYIRINQRNRNQVPRFHGNPVLANSPIKMKTKRPFHPGTKIMMCQNEWHWDAITLHNKARSPQRKG